MNNEKIILSTLRPNFGYTDMKLHGEVNKNRNMSRETFICSIKKLQSARLVHRKDGNLFKTIR